MKLLNLLLCILFVSLAAQADEIELEGTGITFTAPDEFEPLSQPYIDKKWPNKNGPRFAIGNERATTTIAYDVKPQDLSNADLGEILAHLEQAFNQNIRGIEWIDASIIEQGGTSWVYLEMTSSAVDTNIYNIMMLGGVGQETVIFNFNSTREDFPRYEEALRKSQRSVQLP